MNNNYGKDFDWALEINGLDQFLCQDVKLPKATIGTVSHGAPGPVPNVNTPGKPVFGDLVIKKLTPAFVAETWAWQWFAQALSGNPAQFAKTGFVKERAPGFGPTRRKFLIRDMWVKDIDVSNYTAEGENNVIETVTFEVWVCYPTNLPDFKNLFQ